MEVCQIVDYSAPMKEAPTGSVAGHLDVLGLVPQSGSRSIIGGMHRKKLQKSQIVWNQGDEANHVAFLVEGAVISTFYDIKGKMEVTGISVSGRYSRRCRHRRLSAETTYRALPDENANSHAFDRQVFRFHRPISGAGEVRHSRPVD